VQEDVRRDEDSSPQHSERKREPQRVLLIQERHRCNSYRRLEAEGCRHCYQRPRQMRKLLGLLDSSF
ncbi:unnamed protein product, partial [Musa acuminata var. zebrina]